MSRERKILIGGTMTLGIGALGYMALKRLFGRGKKSIEEGEKAAEQTKGGFFKKLLIGTAIGVGAFFGLKYLFNRFGKSIDKKINDMKDSLNDVVGDVTEGAGAIGGAAAGIANETGKLSNPLAKAAYESIRGGASAFNAVREALGDGDVETAIQETLKHGGAAADHMGEFFFVMGGEHLRLPQKLYARANAYLEGKDSSFNLAMTYTETGVLYTVDTAIASAIIKGKIGIPGWQTLGKVVGWPGYVLRDGFWYSYYIVKDREIILTKLGGIPRMFQYRSAMKGARSGSVEGLTNAVSRWAAFDDVQSLMNAHLDDWRKTGFTVAETGRMKEYQFKLAQKIQNTLKNMQSLPDDAAPWLKQLYAEARTTTIDKFMDALKTNIPRSVQSTDEVVETASTVAKGADAAREVVGELNTVEKVQEAITAARKAGNTEQVLKLLKNPILKEAAAQGDDAARILLRVHTLLTVGKYAGRAALVAGPVIDAVLLSLNERAIAQAKKENNEGMVQTLESKRTHLAGMGAAGLGMFALSGPQALAVAPFYLGSSLYANAVYDAAIDWEKTSNDWMKLSPDELKTELRKLPYGHVRMGHRAGLGKWGASFLRIPAVIPDPSMQILGKVIDAKRKAAASDELEAVESVNRNQRQEILTAYFLKTMRAYRYASETDDTFKERMTTAIRDRIQFMDKMTEGTFVTDNMGKGMEERLLRSAEGYAELMEQRRTLIARGIDPAKQKYGELNLKALGYVFDPLDKETSSLACLQLIDDYQVVSEITRDALDPRDS